MELWDIYDKAGNPTGRVIQHDGPIASGDFHLAVDIWIYNSKSELLIQKRSKLKRILPDIWATTGGSVISGETSLQGCVREAKEEVGIDISEADAQLLMRIKGEDTLWDIWVIKQEFDIRNASIQTEEVSAVKWAGIDEIKQLVKKGLFYEYPELTDIYKYVESRDI